MPRFKTVLALLCLGAGLLAAASAQAGAMKEYQTKYYVIYSDHDEATVKEATARITAMAEEYYERTKDFSGKIHQRLPFYLYSNPDDYKAAGGIGAGYYTNDKLMACVPKGSTYSWHIVQHEGFHQFVGQVMRGSMPVWVNEGLAEYFAEGIWTGDAFVTGAATSWRLERVRGMIAKGELRPFDQMFALTSEQWRANLDMRNYDQAWAMVHFLVNADDHKYRKAFSDFLKDCSKGKGPLALFQQRFGADLKPFEDRFKAWWASPASEPSPDLYATAVVQIYTSFLARVTAAKQAFKTWDEFFASAKAATLQSPPDAWLPTSLLSTAVNSRTGQGGTWALDLSGRQPKVVFTRADGIEFAGQYSPDGKGFKTRVDVKRPEPPKAK